MYHAYLLFNMRGDFFDALCEEWLRAEGFDHLPIHDYDMAYCGGGPI